MKYSLWNDLYSTESISDNDTGVKKERSFTTEPGCTGYTGNRAASNFILSDEGRDSLTLFEGVSFIASVSCSHSMK